MIAKCHGYVWIGPGTIEGEIPPGMRLQHATGEPCAIGDVLNAEGVAVLVKIQAPPVVPIFEPIPGEDAATTAKRRQLHAIMLDCPGCDAVDVYDVAIEDLDRDIAMHGGA